MAPLKLGYYEKDLEGTQTVARGFDREGIPARAFYFGEGNKYKIPTGTYVITETEQTLSTVEKLQREEAVFEAEWANRPEDKRFFIELALDKIRKDIKMFFGF